MNIRNIALILMASCMAGTISAGKISIKNEYTEPVTINMDGYPIRELQTGEQDDLSYAPTTIEFTLNGKLYNQIQVEYNKIRSIFGDQNKDAIIQIIDPLNKQYKTTIIPRKTQQPAQPQTKEADALALTESFLNLNIDSSTFINKLEEGAYGSDYAQKISYMKKLTYTGPNQKNHPFTQLVNSIIKKPQSGITPANAIIEIKSEIDDLTNKIKSGQVLVNVPITSFSMAETRIAVGDMNVIATFLTILAQAPYPYGQDYANKLIRINENNTLVPGNPFSKGLDYLANQIVMAIKNHRAAKGYINSADLKSLVTNQIDQAAARLR